MYVAVKFWSFFLHLALGALGAVGLQTLLGLEIAYGFLASINLILFFSFGRDKLAAKLNLWRTPESTFLLLAFCGGFPALFAGRKIFNHKTGKRSFIVPMWILFLFQFFCMALLTHWGWFDDLAGMTKKTDSAKVPE